MVRQDHWLSAALPQDSALRIAYISSQSARIFHPETQNCQAAFSSFDRLDPSHHPIHKFDFTALDGKMKWIAYMLTKLIKNMFDYSLELQKRICSAIEDLPPDIDFDISPSEPQSSQQSNAESTWMLEEGDSQSSLVGSQGVTPTTFTRTTERASKKPRNKSAAGQQR